MVVVVDAGAAVKELRSTFNSGKTKDVEWRISQLKAFLNIVNYHEKEIVEALRSDLNKPELEVVTHEITPFAEACKRAVKKLRKWMKPQKVKTTLISFPSSAKVVPEPLGVVLVISAWNYPFLLSLEPVVGAIAAGNAVVLKPSEIAAATSSLLARLVGKYADSSAIKVIEGAVTLTTTLLEQKWDKILYTGNGNVGRIILSAAAKHLTPVVLELGGKSPVVVDENINLNVAMRRIIAGKWGCNNGQACISPDYIITTKKYASKVIDAMSTELEKFYGKDPLQSNDLSRIVSPRHFDRLAKILDDEKVSDKIIIGGQRDETNLKIAPTVLLDVPEDSILLIEEIFGPLLPIITVDKIEDCYGIISTKDKALVTYLFTEDKKFQKDFLRNVSSGALAINDTALQFLEPGLLFGGVGGSGMGAYHGKHTFDTFSHKKAVLKRGFLGDIPLRYPPYTPQKQHFVKAALEENVLGMTQALFGK